MRTGLVAIAGGFVLAGVLAGCGGGGGGHEPTPNPSAPSSSGVAASTTASSPAETPTPAPTATTPLLTGPAVKPGETPPVENSHAFANSEDGAILFATYFYQALDWSIATSNANLLRPISSPTCKTCQAFISGLDGYAATGKHSEGGRLKASGLELGYGSSVPSDYAIKVTVSQEPQVVVDPGGSRATYAPTSTPAINYLYIKWINGAWITEGIGSP